MNEFEQQLLSSDGNAQEKMRRWYGKELAYGNAGFMSAGRTSGSMYVSNKVRDEKPNV